MNPILRSQICWCLVALLCTVGLYLSLVKYTGELENPAPLLWGMLAAHALRMFFAVRYDLHRYSAKEVGLLSIAAVAAVWPAMGAKTLMVMALQDLESDPEVMAAFTLWGIGEYLDVIHNKVFGMTAFFIASYMLMTKALRFVGNYWAVLEYPRSSLELFGAFYETAYNELHPSVMDPLEDKAKSLLVASNRPYAVPSPNRLI